MAMEAVKYRRDQATDVDREIHEQSGYCSRSGTRMLSLLAEPYVCEYNFLAIK
jgi:hypothetical protein